MSYDPLSSHLTDQKQEGATAKQTKLSPDLLGGSFSFILCCCQNKAWDVVVIYLFDIISITHTVEWWEISWYQQHRSLIGGGEHKDSGDNPKSSVCLLLLQTPNVNNHFLYT